jgi:TolB protein
MRLAYTSPCPGRQDSYPGSTIFIIRVDADGKELDKTQIPPNLGGGDYDPAFAPDGKRLAFTSLRNGQSGIFIINLEDNSLTEIDSFQYADKQPAWSPSGMQLAFVRKFLTTQIITSTDTGQSQREYTQRSPASNLWPAWSADGQGIFYSQAQPEAPYMLMYKRWEDRDTSIETRIPAQRSGNDGPYAQVSPSPDGAWLAYGSWPDQNYDIYIMNINGANQQRLTKDPGIDFWPAWRPQLVPPQP